MKTVQEDRRLLDKVARSGYGWKVDERLMMFDAYDLAVLAGLNFSSVFVALVILRAMDHRRKRKIAETIMQEIGAKMELDQNFSDIIRKNFMNDRNPNDDES